MYWLIDGLLLFTLQLFPYHLSDVIVKGLRITPFSYYCSIMENIMSSERSYDSLPNFTAADCEFKDIQIVGLFFTSKFVELYKHVGFF